MSRYWNYLTFVTGIITVASLAACGPDVPENTVSGGDAANLQQAQQEACANFPDLPGCGQPRGPHPGYAKFTAGRADALRWVGQDGCKTIDIRTGRQQANSHLTKATGDVRFACGSGSPHFSFIFLQHSGKSGADARTSAFLPHNEDAARRLLASCASASRPHPSVAAGSWWDARGTDAEGLIHDYMAPLVYATRLMPFDDDGFERLDDAMVKGVPVERFRNERARVWMDKTQRDRPLRVTNDKDLDIELSEWNKHFAAEVPSGMRKLAEVCTVSDRVARIQSGR